jgi:hypothetical protein
MTLREIAPLPVIAIDPHCVLLSPCCHLFPQQAGPNRGDNPAPVNPGAIGGSSQGTSHLWTGIGQAV